VARRSSVPAWARQQAVPSAARRRGNADVLNQCHRSFTFLVRSTPLPGLTDLDDGDLKHTIDFRDVYAASCTTSSPPTRPGSSTAVTLHAERPVVDTETVPVERVRLDMGRRS
jgi:hypothetical protein